MLNKYKVLIVLTVITALIFGSGAKPQRPTTNPNTTPTTMTGTMHVSPDTVLAGSNIRINYAKSKTTGYIQLFNVDSNTLVNPGARDNSLPDLSGRYSFGVPTDVGHYTLRLYDSDTNQLVCGSNVFQIAEFNPNLNTDELSYKTVDTINVTLTFGSYLDGAEVYIINAETGVEVPNTRRPVYSAPANISYQIQEPGIYKIIHTRDHTGKILARSMAFSVTAVRPPAPKEPGGDFTPWPGTTTTPVTNSPVTKSPGTVTKKTIILHIGSPSMTVNGVSAPVDQASSRTTPVIIGGRTLLPIRSVIEALGGSVAWDGQTQKVTVTLEGKTIEMLINKNTVTVNGTTKTVDVPPQIINGRTMLPIRFVTENLGYSVDWDSKAKQVTINTK